MPFSHSFRRAAVAIAATVLISAGVLVSTAEVASAAGPVAGIGSVSLREGNAGMRAMRFTVALSSPSASPVSVHYATTAGTASAPADFVAASGTLTIAADKLAGVVSVAIKGDVTSEANETFAVTLSSPVGATIGRAMGTGTIVNDDPPPRTVGIGSVSLWEGDAGGRTMRFTVALSAPSASPVSVHYATANGTAKAGTDFVAASGTLTIPAMGTAGVVNVTIKGDGTTEGHEMFSVTLSAPSGATIGRSTGTGTILSDDPPAPDVRVSIASPSLVEGRVGARVLAFPVTLTKPAGAPVSVHWASQQGTATAGSDYDSTNGNLSIPADQLTGFVNVTVRPDTAIEEDETFTITLSSPVGAALGVAVGTGTILNDDNVEVAIGSASLVEGNSGSRVVTFPVALSVASPGTVSVHFATANGSAWAGSDYAATSGTVSIPAGQLTGFAFVTVRADISVEANETMSVTLSAPVGGVVVAPTGTGTILNDD